jgi:hypothetical protein
MHAAGEAIFTFGYGLFSFADVLPAYTAAKSIWRWVMRIVMVPGRCSTDYIRAGGTFCQSCFASFLMHGCYPDRACITEVVDDGTEETTLVLRYGEYEKVVLMTDENRELLAFGGWPGWVQFVEDLPGAPGADLDDQEQRGA